MKLYSARGARGARSVSRARDARDVSGASGVGDARGVRKQRGRLNMGMVTLICVAATVVLALALVFVGRAISKGRTASGDGSSLGGISAEPYTQFSGDDFGDDGNGDTTTGSGSGGNGSSSNSTGGSGGTTDSARDGSATGNSADAAASSSGSASENSPDEAQTAHNSIGESGDRSDGSDNSENSDSSESGQTLPGQSEDSQQPEGALPGSQGASGRYYGSRLYMDDSALYSNAERVTYCVYYYESGDYSVGGISTKTPSASVIKVFIMEYAFTQSALGKLDLQEPLRGTTILSQITSMIQYSDNDATNALIDRLGMDAINAFLLEQGYTDTVLGRKMLDYDRRAAGFDNYTSVEDCMSFLDKLYAGNDGIYLQMLEIMKGQQVRTKIPSKLPSGVVVANKTGELDDVENDIGIVFAEGAPFAIVVLTDGVRNSAGMRNAIADLALSAYRQQFD